MKIVNREEFLAMPEGTLFSRWQPSVFEGVEFKGPTIETHDFLCVELTSTEHFFGEGFSAPLDIETYYRDGCFDSEQLYAVYERDDIRKLISKLNATLLMLESL